MESSAATALSPERVAANVRVVSAARGVVALFAGAATGVCGVHGWLGAVCFVLAQAVYAALAHLHARPHTLAEYLPNGASTLVWENLFQAAMTFVLFWTCVAPCIAVYHDANSPCC